MTLAEADGSLNVGGQDAATEDKMTLAEADGRLNVGGQETATENKYVICAEEADECRGTESGD